MDPIGLQASDPSNPQSLNLYAYCENDPLNSTDPAGTFGFSFSIFFRGFPGGGSGGGPIFGGFLSGLFSFGFGLLGSILGGRNGHILGLPFLGGFQTPTRGAAPVPKPATVAVHGVYGPAMEIAYPYSNQAFHARARYSVGGDENKIRGFGTGDQFISTVIELSNQVGAIGRLNGFFHSTPPGIVGFDNKNRGLYIDYRAHDVYSTMVNYNFTAYPLTEENKKNGARGTKDFVNAILDGRINIANGGEIVLFGCNTDAMASHIQFLLKEGKRGDIRVTGSVGQASFENPTYALGTFNTYSGNNQWGGSTQGRRSYR